MIDLWTWAARDAVAFVLGAWLGFAAGIALVVALLASAPEGR